MSKFIGIILLLVTTGIACALGNAEVTVEPIGVPEIDPASAISGLTLLLGGLAVVRGRRAKK